MTLIVVVTKDGEEISEAMSPNEAFAFVLDHQGQSYEYAMKHGGYSLEVKGVTEKEKK
jgi:hypothetical protein